MPFVPLPIEQWLPDTPDLDDKGITVARNCVPRSSSSYGPLPSLAASGVSALPERVIGAYMFFDAERNPHLFVGTNSTLQHLQAGDAAFTDVSLATYDAAITNPWFLTSYGEGIIATNGVDVPQLFTVGVDSTFTNLAANAPIGKYVCSVRDFVMFGNLTEDGVSYPQRLRWSAIGNPSNYPDIGSNDAAELQSDAQDLKASLGHIQGMAANLQSADIAIFMDQGVYSGSYVGSPAVFSFQIAQGATGCRVPLSIITSRGYAYYLGWDGFYAFDGVQPRAIGHDRVDKWFLTNPDDGADPAYIEFTQGAADPINKLVLWAYCGPNSNGIPNRLLIYHVELDRWSMARVDSEWLVRGLSLGYTLDQLDQFGSLDDLAYSLDSPIWSGGHPILTAFDTSHQLGYFAGPNMEAVIETMEQEPVPGHRVRVTNSRPLVDGDVSPFMAFATRNQQNEGTTYNGAVAVNIYGEVPTRLDARFVRAQITIPAESDWKHCMGAEIDIAGSHRR